MQMVGEQRQESTASAEVDEKDTQNHSNESAEETQTNENSNKIIEDEKREDIELEEVDEECSLEELQSEVERLKEENEKTYERMLRVQAEFENYKRRTQREKAAERKYRSQDLANELLPALDNFERALAIEASEETKSIIDGITMVYEQIKDALKAEGIEEIEAVGQEFDPNVHHAVMQVEDEDEQSNIVVEEMQKGYILKDRVIRPAMVKVNK